MSTLSIQGYLSILSIQGHSTPRVSQQTSQIIPKLTAGDILSQRVTGKGSAEPREGLEGQMRPPTHPGDPVVLLGPGVPPSHLLPTPQRGQSARVALRRWQEPSGEGSEKPWRVIHWRSRKESTGLEWPLQRRFEPQGCRAPGAPPLPCPGAQSFWHLAGSAQSCRIYSSDQQVAGDNSSICWKWLPENIC